MASCTSEAVSRSSPCLGRVPEHGLLFLGNSEACEIPGEGPVPDSRKRLQLLERVRANTNGEVRIMAGFYKAEYIWIDGQEPTAKMRSKGKIVPVGEAPPIWGFDGSSTSQAPGENSDCVLNPVFVCPDPVRGGTTSWSCAKCCSPTCHPILPTPGPPARRRRKGSSVSIPGSALSRIYLLQGRAAPGLPGKRLPPPQGGYYCGVGIDEVFGRPTVEKHMDACLEAGLMISGINGEVMPGQWEFQIGPLSLLRWGTTCGWPGGCSIVSARRTE